MADRQQSVLGNGLKLLGEAFVTGASEMLEGKLASGAAHFLIGSAATVALAHLSPVLAGVTVLAVKADSYSRSINSEGLLSRFGSAMQRPATETEAASSTAAAARAPSRSS